MRTALLSTILTTSAWAQGIIGTFAGTEFLFPDERLPSLSAPLARVQDVALDTKGNLSISDRDNQVVMTDGGYGGRLRIGRRGASLAGGSEHSKRAAAGLGRQSLRRYRVGYERSPRTGRFRPSVSTREAFCSFPQGWRRTQRTTCTSPTRA